MENKNLKLIKANIDYKNIDPSFVYEDIIDDDNILERHINNEIIVIGYCQGWLTKFSWDQADNVIHVEVLDCKDDPNHLYDVLEYIKHIAAGECEGQKVAVIELADNAVDFAYYFIEEQEEQETSLSPYMSNKAYSMLKKLKGKDYAMRIAVILHRANMLFVVNIRDTSNRLYLDYDDSICLFTLYYNKSVYKDCITSLSLESRICYAVGNILLDIDD